MLQVNSVRCRAHPISLFSFLLAYSSCTELKEKSRPTPQEYIFAMDDSRNFRFKAAVSCNVFRLTRTKHSEKCLWFLPEYAWSPEWLSIMERPICWRWAAWCHGERTGLDRSSSRALQNKRHLDIQSSRQMEKVAWIWKKWSPFKNNSKTPWNSSSC